MKQITWSSLVGGLGLLCLLGIFALLASNGSLSVSPVPATSIVRSTVGMTASAVISQSHVISTSQAITHVDWLTFTDLEAGYSIQYPANFIVRSNRSKGEVYHKTDITFLALGVKGYHAMTIAIDPNPQNLPLEMLYEELYKNSLETKASNTLAQVTVAEMVAYQTSMLPGSTDFHILLPHQDKIFHFALVHDLGPMESDPKAKTVFFQILDTFRITTPG